MTQKSLIKMQISPIKNQNFEKMSQNPSNRTKVKIEKKVFGIYLKKIWFPICSVTAEMFEHRNSGEKLKEKKRNFFLKFTKGIQGFDLGKKKKFQIISYLCTFNNNRFLPTAAM